MTRSLSLSLSLLRQPVPHACTSSLLIRSALAGPVRVARGDDVALLAHWFPVAGNSTPRPAVVALHGGGGLCRRDGKSLDARYPEYVDYLHKSGNHDVLADRFASRGSGPICSGRNGERRIKVETRRNETIAAVKWLATREEVDAAPLAELGWPHGTITALMAINAAHREVAQPLAGAVVFYPGCRALLNAPFQLEIALLMLLGEKDDWTPPARCCVRLAQRTRTARPTVEFTVKVYPDRYHGFDGARPVRFRTDVSNGVEDAAACTSAASQLNARRRGGRRTNFSRGF